MTQRLRADSKYWGCSDTSVGNRSDSAQKKNAEIISLRQHTGECTDLIQLGLDIAALFGIWIRKEKLYQNISSEHHFGIRHTHIHTQDSQQLQNLEHN